jgi:hypothetical protein
MRFEHRPSRGLLFWSLAAWLGFIGLPGPDKASAASEAGAAGKAAQRIVDAPTRGFVWPNRPPHGCPFEPSREFNGLYFTGLHYDYPEVHCDTWYPTWAANGHQYSPWADGRLEGVRSFSIDDGSEEYHDSTTGNAVIEGDDPRDLTFRNIGRPQPAKPQPYTGRYPCGSLVYNGVWYYGEYCLGPETYKIRHGGFDYNWPILGPMTGFRISTDYGETWTLSPLSPGKPLFPEPEKYLGPVKMGAPHFVDFGRNMEHSPDGKAYLLGIGAEGRDAEDRYANLSWVCADQVYLARVMPSPENINDVTKYEFFAGLDESGRPIWTGDFSRIKPLLDWNNNMGVATMTYDAPLKKYLMCVTDGWPTCGKMHTYVLESDAITGPWRLVTYMKDFGEQAYFVNLPSKFIGPDGRTLWILYSANYASEWNGMAPLKANPAGSDYGVNLHKIRLLSPGQNPGGEAGSPLTGPANVASRANVSVSSRQADRCGEGATDGTLGGYPGDTAREWASDGEKAGAWIVLTWDQPQRIDRVWLFDRPNPLDQVTGGILEFSDGSSVELEKRLPNNAMSGLEIAFPEKTVSWLKFRVTAVKPGSTDIGLAEIGVFRGEQGRS